MPKEKSEQRSAIRKIERNKSTNVNLGAFQLPHEFDQEILTGKWVKDEENAIRESQRDEVIQSEGVEVDGWNVWKDAQGKSCVVSVASGKYVLMFRPKSLQKAINVLHGNASRRRIIHEHEGRTVAGEGGKDGILTDEQLNKFTPYTDVELIRDQHDSQFKLTEVDLTNGKNLVV